ncbi:MAG: hypothetical protein ACM3H7_04955 [Acidobacteriaceae bacterium]
MMRAVRRLTLMVHPGHLLWLPAAVYSLQNARESMPVCKAAFEPAGFRQAIPPAAQAQVGS